MAQTRLGYLYGTGLDVPLNYAEAEYWYKKAAAQGDGVAQGNLLIVAKRLKEEQTQERAKKIVASDEARGYKPKECDGCTQRNSCGGFFSSSKQYRYSDHITPYS